MFCLGAFREVSFSPLITIILRVELGSSLGFSSMVSRVVIQQILPWALKPSSDHLMGPCYGEKKKRKRKREKKKRGRENLLTKRKPIFQEEKRERRGGRNRLLIF